MKKQITFLSLIISGLVFLSACSETDFSRYLQRGGSNTPEDVTETETTVPPGAVDPTLTYFNVTNSWNQGEGGALVRPEVVFVIDQSGSMVNEVTALKNSIESWTSQIESQGIYDYCLGVMKAESNASTVGRLVAASGNEKCICTYGDNAVSSATAVTEFRQNLDAVLGSSGGGSKEVPIYSLSQALNDPAKLSANQDDGCFRDDAALVGILVSDEDDAGYTPDQGGNTFNNDFFLGAGNSYNSTRGDEFYGAPGDSSEDNQRISFYTDGTTNGEGDYVNNLTHETLIADIQAYNGDSPTFGAALGYHWDNLPGEGQGDPFRGGIEFAESFGYDLVDMKDVVDGNQAAFEASMNNMADALVEELTFYDSFSLSDTICDVDGDDDFTDEEDNVTVTVNGADVAASNWSINSSGTKIIFDQDYDWAASDAVEIQYIRCE